MILTCGNHRIDTNNPWNQGLFHGSRCPVELSYDKMAGIRRCGRHLYPAGRSVKHWAAIKGNIPKTRGIACIGFGPACAYFDKGIFKFSYQGYIEWVASGAQYCELFTNDWPEKKALLKHYPHGPIRKCKDTC